MMDWTDVHFRQLCRLMTKRTTLWTEMVVDSTIVYTDGKPLACVASGNGEGFDGMTELDRHLWFPPEQRPLVLQVGGSEPEQLRKAAAIAARYEYDEININCGCPSDRVAGKGRFGVCLMFSPEDVADCVKALEEGQTRPVTVKCRIGVDDNDTYDEMKHFVATVSSRTNCRHFIVHARKAWLQGLNPHLNRTIPPLKHEWVFALMRDFPHIEFSLNGGVGGCHEARDALAYRAPGVDRGLNGVMIGRAAYNYPWHCLADADRAVYGEADNPAPNRRWLLREYAKYGDEMIGRFGTDRKGDKKPDARMILKHTLNVFHAERGAREWRRRLEDLFHKPGLSCTDIVEEAMACMSDEVLDSPPPQNYVELERKGYVPVAGAKPGTDVDVQLPEDGSERAAPPRIGKRLATEEEAARLRRAPTPAPAQQTVGSSS
ncbi:unnamed protein product [Pedinophyceae sp. YPF-701]|nr:unnamed protein product [Pedinophyceae sp. YPF-701]